ncbi:MAG TPA: TlpA disulfide reductase family protein [Acidimicrobiales bacterium]|nr:TlpA disulfide reductase family protein [Acidimicrobiales bacterium]
MTAVEEAAPAPARGRGRTALIAAGIVGLVVALFVGVLATRKPADQRIAPSTLQGRPAPDTAGPDLNGTQVQLSQFKGQYVLVNFFATWCIPCVDEQPELVRFQQRHGAAGDATIVSIIYQDRLSDVRQFFKERGGGWPVIQNEGSKVDWGVRGVPESFLVDPDGVVLTRIVGGVRDASLEQLLAQAKQFRQGS